MQAEFSGGVLVCNGMVTLRRVSSILWEIHNFPFYIFILIYIVCAHISLVSYFVADGGRSNQLGGNCV